MNSQLLLREAIELTRREALARPNTFDATARTIEAVIATDAPVQRRDERGVFHEILDIAGADLEALRGASVLDSHRQGGVASVIGTIEEGWREANQLVARIRLSARSEIAAVVQDIRDGILSSLSVGYEVAEWRDGRNGDVRTRTAVKWTPREVSFVPVSADPNARTRGHDGGRASINRQIRELATRAGASRDLADDLIDREADIETARAAMFDNLLTRGRQPIRSVHNDHTAADNPEIFIRAVGEALYMRAAPSHTPSSGLTRQYIGQRIDAIAAECLRRSGMQITGLSGDTLITRALHTTSDFALILGDTINRTLRASYTAAPSGIRQLARQSTAADFRNKTSIMLDSSGLKLEKVNEHGEFKSGTITEGGETYKLETFGRIFGITRQALVNDNLGAFTDLTRRLGQAAGSFEAQALVDLVVGFTGLGPNMADGVAVFDVLHNNIQQGAGTAPTEAALSAARLKMRQQTSLAGELIDVVPRYLLVPPQLETVSEKLLSTIQATVVDDVNPFAHLSLIVEPRLLNATRWYLVADPALVDGLEYSYLAGQPGPQTESQAGFRIDGVEVKVRLDYGAGWIDYRGWQTNAGA